LIYTSVLDGRLDLGRIALARPLDDELVAWAKHAGGPVLEPPHDPNLTHFRDPFVWRRPGAWQTGQRMGQACGFSSPVAPGIWAGTSSAS